MLKALFFVGVVAAVMGLAFFFIMFISPIAAADQGLVHGKQADWVMIGNTGCPAGFKSATMQLRQATTYNDSEGAKVGDRLHRVSTQTDAGVARQRAAIRQAVGTGKG